MSVPNLQEISGSAAAAIDTAAETVRAYPLPIDPACELPDRRGIIEDLADFAVVLRPSLDGMQANRLCRLVEKYAACDSRQSDVSVSLLAGQTGTPNGRTQRENCGEPVATLHG